MLLQKKTKMEVKRSEYQDGNIQSVGFFKDGVPQVTTGIMKKGSYNLGKANPRETMKCTSGEMIINGQKCTADSPPVVIEVGENINFEVLVNSTYTCTYN